jgi:hypothetical protein
MNIIEHIPAKLDKPKAPKFFLFRQNNSYGSFVINDNVAHFVIIEAYSPKEANARAEAIGVYFDGCMTFKDCSCCGDRWNSQWDDDKGDDTPLIYGKEIGLYEELFAKEGQPVCHVHHLDGSKTTYRKAKKDKQNGN